MAGIEARATRHGKGAALSRELWSPLKK
jgi:hypothetical protein